MNDQRYILDWRGVQKGPWGIEEIEARLAEGEINSLHSIRVDGQWVVLRDFLEHVRAEAAHAGKQAQASPPPPMVDLSPPQPQPPPLPPFRVPPSLPAPAPPPPFQRQGSHMLKWLIAGFASAGVVVAALLYWMSFGTASTEHSKTGDHEPDRTAVAEPAANQGLTPAGSALDDEGVAEKVSPYVVQVSVRWKAVNKAGVRVEQGSDGSGVHIANTSQHAIFVTNFHVVEVPSNAQEIEYIMTTRDKKIPFGVIARGRYGLDLAKLQTDRLDSGGEAELKIATLKDLKPGQQCVAIGNALGAGISVTAGVISAFDEWQAGKYIRTDAAISSGNSGGGLFRKRDGCLIGITTLASKGSSTRAVQNFNLAIPMDYVLSELFWDKSSED